MHREGHLGVALLVYAPIAAVLLAVRADLAFAFGLVGMMFWSFAPDFDLEAPLVSHRGITHTYLAAVVAGVASAAVGVYLLTTGVGDSDPASVVDLVLGASFGFGIGVLGVVSHLLGDVITPMGLRPKQPFSEQKIVLGWVRASNDWANKALWVVGSVTFVGAVIAGYYIRQNGLVMPG